MQWSIFAISANSLEGGALALFLSCCVAGTADAGVGGTLQVAGDLVGGDYRRGRIAFDIHVAAHAVACHGDAAAIGLYVKVARNGILRQDQLAGVELGIQVSSDGGVHHLEGGLTGVELKLQIS